jgi:hypothetical protein
MKQLDFHWTDFLEISYWGILQKNVGQIRVWLKWGFANLLLMTSRSLCDKYAESIWRCALVLRSVNGDLLCDVTV